MEHTDAVSLMWNHLMSEMECCGVESYQDFELSENWRNQRSGKKVPEACCLQSEKRLKDERCPFEPTIYNSHLNKVKLFFQL